MVSPLCLEQIETNFLIRFGSLNHDLKMWFDYDFVINSLFPKILSYIISKEAYVDREMLFNYIAEDVSITERIFHRAVLALRDN